MAKKDKIKINNDMDRVIKLISKWDIKKIIILDNYFICTIRDLSYENLKLKYIKNRIYEAFKNNNFINNKGIVYFSNNKILKITGNVLVLDNFMVNLLNFDVIKK